MYQILLITIVILAYLLVFLILMQQGKGADAGAAFGSGASGTVFGARGAGTFLSRMTAILATLFFVNCLALAWLIARETAPDRDVDSVVDRAIEEGVIQDLPGTGSQATDLPSLPDASVVPEEAVDDLPVSDAPVNADLPTAGEDMIDEAAEAVDEVGAAVEDAVDTAEQALDEVSNDP